MAMILNKKKFNNAFLDENIFLYLEEIDLCKRMREQGENILEINVEIDHLGGQSHGQFDQKWKTQEIGIGCGLNFIFIKTSQLFL